jgi:hypothetical protein
MNQAEPTTDVIKMDLPEKVWLKAGRHTFKKDVLLLKPLAGEAAIWGSTRKAVEKLFGADGNDIFEVSIKTAKVIADLNGYSVGIIFNEDLIEIGRFTV